MVWNELIIYNILASLGEHRLRDLNDEINRMINEKTLWELRIMELNGPDYRVSIKMCIELTQLETTTKDIR
jgi:pre-mRNA-splicing factor ISY1